MRTGSDCAAAFPGCLSLPELALQASAMLSDQDVWRAAIALVDRYGADACAEASKRATDMVVTGNFSGRTEWMRIMAAVLELQEKEPPGPVH